ncbi:hypothetical protein NIES4102_32250 [Chondrocystis sp. NIES-4102]|nr:hypothetical protein NIES4102_32250 [Chondrocystis sp. NIES-4102]
MTGSISDKIIHIQQQIPANVKLIAISKQVPIEAMREAYQVGIRDFGENRLQEAVIKQEQLIDLTDINWHFIGHIQKNKAKKIIEHFDWIHSVDSLPIAQRLNKLAQELNRTPKIFLQVKPLIDPNKYGWQPQDLLTDLTSLSQCQHLNIQGLMTILPFGLSDKETFQAFETIGQLAVTIKQKNYPNLTMQELSMGMSDDYLQAIKAGTTMIRLGRTIFGQRQTN